VILSPTYFNFRTDARASPSNIPHILTTSCADVHRSSGQFDRSERLPLASHSPHTPISVILYIDPNSFRLDMPNTLIGRVGLTVGPLFLETLVKHYFARVIRDGSKLGVPLRSEELLYDEAFNIVKVLSGASRLIISLNAYL